MPETHASNSCSRPCFTRLVITAVAGGSSAGEGLRSSVNSSITGLPKVPLPQESSKSISVSLQGLAFPITNYRGSDRRRRRAPRLPSHAAASCSRSGRSASAPTLYGHQLYGYHHDRHRQGHVELRYEERQRVHAAAQERPCTRDQAAPPGGSPPGELPIVGESLGDRHADSRPYGR